MYHVYIHCIYRYRYLILETYHIFPTFPLRPTGRTHRTDPPDGSHVTASTEAVYVVMGAIDADASGSISWAEFLSAIFLSQEGEHWNTRHDVGLEKAWKMEIKKTDYLEP